MEPNKIGVFLQASQSLSSKITQINDTLLDKIIKNESLDIVVYLIGEQKDQLVTIPSLYTSLWDLALNYNKPKLNSIVYPLQTESSLTEIEHIKILYYDESLSQTVEEILNKNHIDLHKFEIHPINLDIWNEYCRPLDFGNIQDVHYEYVCLGGTFDCLHPGHRILLTLACLVSNHLVIGVTSQEMLKTKVNYEKIKSYEERCQVLRDFCSLVKPRLSLEIKPLHDIYGPSIEYDYLDAIIVSLETYKGGYQINEVRKSKGMKPLTILTVNRTCKYNLSSTFIRDHLE